MTDKVYPVLSGSEDRYGRPSAPPIGLSDQASSTLSIQMPTEKAIHREQEKRLISDYHPSATNNQVFTAGQQSAVGGGHRRRGRSCCCCCLASFVGTLAAIVIIVGLAALVVYLALKPKAPKFSVTKATVNEFKLSTGPPTIGSFNLNTDVVFSIEARNPNNKISLYYDDVAVSLLYANQQIGEGAISAFQQPHKNTTLLTLPIQGSQAPLMSSTGAALQSSLKDDDGIPLQGKAVTKARVKIGRWKSRRYKVRVICSFELSNPNSKPAQVSVLSQSCKLKLKIAHITLTF
ncbi:hypothetical protein GOP47_0019320 [Adiantum capillus-veneris]|uniref:Late embryogenesis abundant protein LEA-2 subgroup domain-containing protein n=1 Tax=Adiantum capillus-veneris TaxID=13818 RepID=A0A9D4UEX5_ADICA|nr:hypothetical protein GOP47_0019320 [Adiantum capillus-veneris]